MIQRIWSVLYPERPLFITSSRREQSRCQLSLKYIEFRVERPAFFKTGAESISTITEVIGSPEIRY